MFGLSQREKDRALFYALREGKTKEVCRLLERGADPNYTTYNVGPVLFQALSLTDEDASLACVKALLAKGAALDKRNDYGYLPVHSAACHRYYHLEVMKTLIEAGADINALDRNNYTPLFLAINKKSWPTAEFLLDYCSRKDESSIPVLVAAVRQGAPVKFIRKLIQKLEIDVNALDPYEKVSALSLAVSSSQRDTVSLLLAQPGIDVNCRDGSKQTPLHRAVSVGRPDLVQLLLDAGAKPGVQDGEGHVPLVSAARGGQQEILEMLVGTKAALDQAEKGGMTALAVAASEGSIRMVKALLAAAAVKKTPLELGAPLQAAAEKGHGRVIELLIGAGADVNAADLEGRTPLMKAALSDQVEALSILVQAGAKPDMADRHGMYAYDHAVSSGKKKAKEYLARYRHETIANGDKVDVATPTQDYRFLRVNDHSLEVREGEGLTMTFNFWTQQVIFRDTERPAPVTVQNFADLQRQEAIDEAYAKLKELGGTPPDPHVTSVKKAPGLTRPL